ncbi:MAG: DNA polymerase III subunit [Fusobacteriaceae bacterium]|jgi:DNA polymerase-3 subunit delta'|nr:DNA polymerase III subunit [Fusobacteriaceae bacterium]
MIADLVAKDEIKKFFKNELKTKRNFGTYLFYGNDSAQLFDYAIALSKGLCCQMVENDFCDSCNTCNKINKGVYSDLEVIFDPNGIKVDNVREIIQKSSVTSFEGKNKIFILKDVQNMKKEATNALLKLIEEPNNNCFYIMLTNSLNILPTIKSRSIILKIKEKTAEDLGVNHVIYNFFRGSSSDILAFKASSISMEEDVSYDKIGVHLKKYIEEKDFYSKVSVYKAIRDFLDNRSYLTLQDKLYFIEEILKNSGTREIYKEIINYTIGTMTYADGIEKRLELKLKLKFPINIKLALINIFVNS